MGKMEYQFMIIDQHQNTTTDNGYGKGGSDPSKTEYLRIWSKFYNYESGVGENTTFPIYKSHLDENIYTKLPFDHYLNNQVYKTRMKMTIEPFLRDANQRAQDLGKEAYCHVVGLGIGVWAVHQVKQAELIYQVYKCILEENPNDFDLISDIDFSYFPPNSGENDNFKGLNTHIKIIFSKNNPFSLENSDKNGKLIVAQFAWDSNAYPGNELWIGQLTASGDPAAACCSGIAAMYEGLNNGDDQKVIAYGSNLKESAPAPSTVKSSTASAPIPAPAPKPTHHHYHHHHLYQKL